jgi:hypothetical protein
MNKAYCEHIGFTQAIETRELHHVRYASAYTEARNRPN